MRIPLGLLSSTAALALLSSISPMAHAIDFADLADHVKRFGEQARLHQQQPLPAEKADVALIFIGGFADELGGYFYKVSQALPALPEAGKQLRSYYQWHYGKQSESHLATQRLARDIEAFRQLNPSSPVVIMGHSLGAAKAVEAARALSAKGGPIYLVTVDPVDRDAARTRPAQVTWWGNSYVVHSQSNRDFVHEMSGRWKAVPAADVNLRFDGREADERGYYFIHDNAWSLINSRAGHERSLREELVQAYRSRQKPIEKR